MPISKSKLKYEAESVMKLAMEDVEEAANRQGIPEPTFWNGEREKMQSRGGKVARARVYTPRLTRSGWSFGNDDDSLKSPFENGQVYKQACGTHQCSAETIAIGQQRINTNRPLSTLLQPVLPLELFGQSQSFQ